MEGGVVSINGFPRISISQGFLPNLSNQFLSPTITSPICHRAKTNSATAFATASTSTTTSSSSADGTVRVSLARKRFPSRTRRPAREASLLHIQNSPNLLDALARSGVMLKAQNIIVREFGRLKWYTDLSQLFAGCIKDNDGYSKAMQLVKNMESNGMQMGHMTYGTLIAVYAANCQFKEAEEYFISMMSEGHYPNIYHYSSVLNAFSADRNYRKADELVNDMKSAGLVPNKVMLTTLLKAYAIACLFEISWQILSELEASSYGGDEMPNCFLMDALSKSKQIAEAKMGLDEMRKRQIAAAPVDVVVGRSGRTLWNVLADVSQFRWGPHAAESPRSLVKYGVPSSSSDFPSSEASFGGHDPDEVQVGNMRSATSSTIPEPSSTDGTLLIRTSTQSPTVHNAPSSSSGGIYGETNLELNVDDQALQASTSVDWSQPAAGLFRRSYRCYATIELQEGGKEAVGSGRGDHIKDDFDSIPCEFSDTGDNAPEVERRKLLRNKQVVRERFEEWEEAYRMESEQRKMDEIFMREALEEAKKAADMWEVPVGAVLVQDGKIVARGYNLVEDLMDSTAHAEMICIREASNVLKAWRLSGTTLYVTLEPCAMCAGAILQARIGTLVYGAPNKLLGADGSWIRLFPISPDGESTAKPEGPPVHPFHPNMTIRRGILEAECADAMQQFFRLRRKMNKKN